MSTGREHALALALGALREQLRQGEFPPGGRIPASALAADLHLSATPVREALSRLAGEGLVEERRNQGFFVRTLSGADVADLYRIALAQLLVLGGRERGRPMATPDAEAACHDPIRAVEDLFQAWMGAAGSRALLRMHLTTATQLGPVRRIEPQVFDDLRVEAEDLLGAAGGSDPAEFLQALRRFHGRRIQASERLVAALHRGVKI